MVTGPGTQGLMGAFDGSLAPAPLSSTCSPPSYTLLCPGPCDLTAHPPTPPPLGSDKGAPYGGSRFALGQQTHRRVFQEDARDCFHASAWVTGFMFYRHPARLKYCLASVWFGQMCCIGLLMWESISSPIFPLSFFVKGFSSQWPLASWNISCWGYHYMGLCRPLAQGIRQQGCGGSFVPSFSHSLLSLTQKYMFSLLYIGFCVLKI